MQARFNSLLARLLIGSGIPLVLFGAVALVAAIAIERLRDSLREEKQAHDTIVRVLDLQARLDRMVLALRLAPVKDVPPHQIRAAVATLQADRRDRHADFQARLAALAEAVPAGSPQAAVLRAAGDREAGWDRQFEDSLTQIAAQPNLSPREWEAGVRSFSTAAQFAIEDAQGHLRAFVGDEEELLAQRRARTAFQTRQSIWLIAVMVPAATLLTILVALGTTRSVTRPIRRLREGVDQLLAGHFHMLQPRGPTELAELAVRLNHVGLTLMERVSALEATEDRYRQYVGSSAHITWAADAKGRIVAELPTWRAYTGQTEAELEGAGWLDAIHPEDRSATAAAWHQAVAEGRLYESEYRLRSAAGEYRSFLSRGVPILNPDGSVREWIGTCIDMEEGKRQARLEHAKEAAEAASRAKSAFLTKMSHELRTPLNAVIGMSKMLSTRRLGPLTAKQADYLHDITSAGEHLLAMINDILDLSKVEAGRMDVRPEPFGLAATVTELVESMRPAAESKGVALRGEPPAAEGTLVADLVRFKQILYNLLSNAIKFTPAGGSVTVRALWAAAPTREPADAPEASAPAVCVSVCDTGIGIAPADQGAIWEEFRQLPHGGNRVQEGTGLGLALTRRLVHLLGGTVWLESEPGRGSSFHFALPRRPVGTGIEEGSDRPAANAHRPTALVIEDYPPTHKLLVDWLEEAGLTTVSAFDGAAGLREARLVRPQLIVLDLQLPQLDGWQVLTALKSSPETAFIPVVIVSVTEDRHPASGLEVQDFFVKPIDRDDFLRRLREIQPGLFDLGRPLRALVVDDSPPDRSLLRDLLAREGASVIEATNGREALDYLRDAPPPDVALIDLLLPDVDGLAIVEAIRAEPRWDAVPLMVLTAKTLTDEERERLEGRIQAMLFKHRLSPERLHQQLQALGFGTGLGTEISG